MRADITQVVKRREIEGSYLAAELGEPAFLLGLEVEGDVAVRQRLERQPDLVDRSTHSHVGAAGAASRALVLSERGGHGIPERLASAPSPGVSRAMEVLQRVDVAARPLDEKRWAVCRHL